MPRLALPILLCACGHPEAPPSCDAMCGAAEVLYGGCLADWGVGWEGAGYRDARDFRDACGTWSWEMAILEDDAVRRGRLPARGALAEACGVRAAALSAADASCATYATIDWNRPPWELP